MRSDGSLYWESGSGVELTLVGLSSFEMILRTLGDGLDVGGGSKKEEGAFKSNGHYPSTWGTGPVRNRGALLPT